jgi:hypothetical protein
MNKLQFFAKRRITLLKNEIVTAGKGFAFSLEMEQFELFERAARNSVLWKK